MNEPGIFYIHGEQIKIEPINRVRVYPKQPRRLKFVFAVLLVLAVGILAGSLDSWAYPTTVENRQEK